MISGDFSDSREPLNFIELPGHHSDIFETLRILFYLRSRGSSLDFRTRVLLRRKSSSQRPHSIHCHAGADRNRIWMEGFDDIICITSSSPREVEKDPRHMAEGSLKISLSESEKKQIETETGLLCNRWISRACCGSGVFSELSSHKVKRVFRQLRRFSRDAATHRDFGSGNSFPECSHANRSPLALDDKFSSGLTNSRRFSRQTQNKTAKGHKWRAKAWESRGQVARRKV